MIDVSSYQGKIDWHKVHDQGGVRMAYIKLGENFVVDSYALQNVRGARAADVKVGLYFYGHPSHSPAQEARWFIRTAHPLLQAGDLPPALDLEVSEGHPWPYLNDWKATWLKAVDSEVGVRAVFYSYYSFWKSMTLYADRPVWGADLDRGFVPPSSWFAHQHSFTGTVPGIGGHVDLDRVLWTPKLVGEGKL